MNGKNAWKDENWHLSVFDHIKNSLLLFINKIKLILKINDAIKNMHKEKKKTQDQKQA